MTHTQEAMMALVLSGDATGGAASFVANPAQRSAMMRRLLDHAEDAPIAAGFHQIWQDITPDSDDSLLALMRWYLNAEAATRHPARAATHRATLTRVLAWPGLRDSEAAQDLGFAAVRIAAEATAPLTQHRAAAACLSRLMGQWRALPARTVRAPMLTAAMATLDFSSLRDLIDHLPPAPRPPDLQRAHDWALRRMLKFQAIDPWLARAIDRAYAEDPASPLALTNHARRLMTDGGDFRALVALFHALPDQPADANFKAALHFAYWAAKNDDLLDDMAAFSARIAQVDPTWAPTRVEPPPVPATAPTDDLAGLLLQAYDLCAQDLSLGTPHTAPFLTAVFTQIASAIATAPLPADWTLQTIAAEAAHLAEFDHREFAWITHFVDVPHALGQPQYGAVDFHRPPALHDGLMAVGAALTKAGLERALQGHPVSGSFALAELVKWHSRFCLDLNRPEPLLALLNRLGQGGFLADLIATEVDNAHLRAQDLAALQGPPPLGRADSQICQMLPRDGFTAAEDLTWTVLAQDAPIPGRFDVAWPDGRVIAYDHATPPGQIATAPVPGLSVLGEDLPIGPKGTILRPDPYHTSRDFPRPSPVLVAGQSGAVRIRPGQTRSHDGPVLVLEAFEALYWHNYYHWMIPLLSRVALAQETGLLDHRRLVVPQGLRRWMLETLQMIGLPPSACVEVAPDERLICADALLMSSVEHVSPAAVLALRRRLMGPMAAQPMRADGPCLYLSRRQNDTRRLDNEAALEAMAADMGFHIIAPQDMSITEQMQLFATARGIAAPEGAALTNTLFCPPGTRVLALINAQDMMPIYNDLSLVLGHHHRKLAGRPAPDQVGTSRFSQDFTIDLDLARPALAWVMGQEVA